MRAITHVSFSLLTLGLFSSVLHCPLSLINIIAAGFSSLLPDIDTSHSTLGKILSPILKPLHERFDHRTITHSLLFVGFLACLLSPLIILNKALFIAIILGYLSHLVIDCINKTGVPLFWPKPIYFIAPGNPRWRIQVGSIQEYILCGVLLLLLAATLYIQGIGFRSFFIKLLANPEMAVSEYQRNANKHLMKASVSGFDRLTQNNIHQEQYEIVDSLNKNTLIVKNEEGQLTTIGSSETAIVQADKLKIQKIKPISVKTKVFKLDGQNLSVVLESLSSETYVTGKVIMRMKPRYIKDDLQPFESNEFESIKVSAGTTEFEAVLDLKDATVERLKPISDYSVSGTLIARLVD